MTIERPTCWVLLYDLPVETSDFTLVLKGIEVGDRPVSAPTLTFKKGWYLRNTTPW